MDCLGRNRCPFLSKSGSAAVPKSWIKSEPYIVALPGFSINSGFATPRYLRYTSVALWGSFPESGDVLKNFSKDIDCLGRTAVHFGPSRVVPLYLNSGLSRHPVVAGFWINSGFSTPSQFRYTSVCFRDSFPGTSWKFAAKISHCLGCNRFPFWAESGSAALPELSRDPVVTLYKDSELIRVPPVSLDILQFFSEIPFRIRLENFQERFRLFKEEPLSILGRIGEPQYLWLRSY